MKRSLGVVLGISLACIFIVAIVIQVTFGGSGIDLSNIQPHVAEIEVGSTCTYNITLFSFEGNWFLITIITDTCDPSWFEWLERGPIRLGESETKQMSLNVTPSKAGDFNFTVRAEAWMFEEASSEIDARVIATGQSKEPVTCIGPVACIGLQPSLPAPQKITAGQSEIIWTAYACDPEGGEIEYRFKLNGPRTNYATKTVKAWSRSNVWVWLADSRDVGNSTIYADVRIRHHDATSSFVYRDYGISLIQLPCCTCLMPDKSEPQVGGTAITWTACSNYPDRDQLRYRFWVYNGCWNVVRDWARSNSWTWTPSDTGDYDIKVEVCDGTDDNVSVGNATYWEYSISTKNS